MLMRYCYMLIYHGNVIRIKSAFRLDALNMLRSHLGEVECLRVRCLSCRPDILDNGAIKYMVSCD